MRNGQTVTVELVAIPQLDGGRHGFVVVANRHQNVALHQLLQTSHSKLVRLRKKKKVYFCFFFFFFFFFKNKLEMKQRAIRGRAKKSLHSHCPARLDHDHWQQRQLAISIHFIHDE
jgi:hypothetical protein